MYDFTNLSDVEFERLSADILSRELGVRLRYFAPGRDGGIDLVDDVAQKNVVVQVKHYAKSKFPSLLSSLKKEVDKVKKLNPGQYFVCVSQELTASNINDIYNLFKEYMRDTNNIIHRNDLVEFLNKEGNQDILRKNFKLWLLSDRLLKDIFNNEVFIDSEVLLDDIDKDFNYFVETTVFNEALDVLKKNRILLLYGAPGVGKSINSKMLAAAFVKEDYIVRYTTDGKISRIKSVISESPDVKEVILLDDCLGQYYFNLRSGQDRELISLIKYIKQHKNKVLILNTRVTILNEAKRARFEFRDFLEADNIPLRTIDMERITKGEKAEIFYNHLSKNQIPRPYFEKLRKGKKYVEIILHNNYNPRIIEFVTRKHRYSKIDFEQYPEYILMNLKDPKEVWADEFNERLEEIDRIFMYTLFSLTDTHVDIDVLKDCFIYRLMHEGRAHSTVDYFANTIERLTKSLIRIIDVNGTQMIGVLNPSINDYMNSYLKSNTIGLNAIKDSILYIEQMEKMYEPIEIIGMLNELLSSGEYLKLKSIDQKKFEYLYFGIVRYTILLEDYKPLVKEGFKAIKERINFLDTTLEKKEIVLEFLINKDLFDFYCIGEGLKDIDFLNHFISNLDYTGIIEVLSAIEEKCTLIPEIKDRIYDDLFDELHGYIDVIDIDEYIESNYDFEDFYELIPFEDNRYKVDSTIKELCIDIQNKIIGSLLDDLRQMNSYSDIERIAKEIEESVKMYTTEEKIYDVLERNLYPEPDYDHEYDDDDRGYDSGETDVVDIIFDRDIIYYEED